MSARRSVGPRGRSVALALPLLAAACGGSGSTSPADASVDAALDRAAPRRDAVADAARPGHDAAADVARPGHDAAADVSRSGHDAGVDAATSPTDASKPEAAAPPDGGKPAPDGGGDAAQDVEAGPPPAGVTVLAGKPGGSGNLDALAAAARLYQPGFVADDGAGHLYVSDRNAVRAVDLATGAVTTLAGVVLSPPFGKVADSSCNFSAAEAVDGVGTAARFNGLLGVAADGAGDLYVADSCNNTLRKIVVASQTVTTFVGTAGTPGSADGTGTAAELGLPAGVVYDGAGHLYFTDDPDTRFARPFGGDTVREVDLATGKVTTLAGSPAMPGSADGKGAAASFDAPAGLAYVAGVLYVADANNDTIRALDVRTRQVTTVAGTAGNAGFADGVGAAAAFDAPVGVAYDGAGSLYVTDSGNSVLRKIALSNFKVTTVAGAAGVPGDDDGAGAAARLAVPFGVALDPSGALYLADQTYQADPFVPPIGGSTVREFVPSTAALTTVAGAPPSVGSADGPSATARFDLQLGGLAYDGAGTVYVADSANAVVRKVDVATGVVSILAGASGQSGHTDATGEAARFILPTFLASDGAGRLYVSDALCNNASPQVCAPNPSLRVIDTATGAVTTLTTLPWGAAASDGATDFSNPLGLALDGAGHLYLADNLAVTVRAVDLATGAYTTLAGSGMVGTADGAGSAASFEFPYALAYDGQGDLFVTDWDASTVRRIVVATGEVSTFAGKALDPGSSDGVGAAARFDQPQGVAFDGAGHLYVTDAALLGQARLGGGTLRQIDLATGRVTTVAGSPGVLGVQAGALRDARFNDPAGLAAWGGASGETAVFVSDLAEDVLLQVRVTP